MQVISLLQEIVKKLEIHKNRLFTTFWLTTFAENDGHLPVQIWQRLAKFPKNFLHISRINFESSLEMRCFKTNNVASAVVWTLSFIVPHTQKSRDSDQGCEEVISQQRSAYLQRTIIKKVLLM